MLSRLLEEEELRMQRERGAKLTELERDVSALTQTDPEADRRTEREGDGKPRD